MEPTSGDRTSEMPFGGDASFSRLDEIGACGAADSDGVGGTIGDGSTAPTGTISAGGELSLAGTSVATDDVAVAVTTGCVASRR